MSSNILNTKSHLRAQGCGIIAVATLMLSCALAAFEYTVQEYPQAMSLDGDWQFKWTADAREADAYRWFYEDGFDYTGFATLPVPSNWTTHGFEEPHYVDGTQAEGFYVRTFEVPDSIARLRTLLHFGGVWVSAEVWLNGRNLGRHDSGFTPFAFDIRDAIKPGEVNVLCVRVRQQIGGELFKYDANDDWGLPGIYRSVWLEFSPSNLYIENVEILTRFDEYYRDADVDLRVHVYRRERDHFRFPSPPFRLRATVLTLAGDAVASAVEDFSIGGANMGRDVRFRVPVKSPLQWNAETPNLYRLRIELMRDEDVLVHTWEDSFGFREVSVAGGVFRINGQAVKLRGVNRHDQHPEVGRATREEHWREDLLLMKAANINAVRMAHYPHAEGFVRMCDEIGMYLIAEVPLGFGGNRFNNPIFSGGMMQRLYSTVERDRNRPSVVVWGFGNEDPLTSMHVSGIRALKGLDPSRPILLPFRAEQETPPEVDILAPHYWFSHEYDHLGATTRRPVITTEYTHAMGRSQDFGELADRWNALTQHASGAGAFIWLWNDQGLLRNTEGKEVLHPMDDKSRYTRTGSEFVRDKDAGPGAIYDAHGHYGTDGIVDADREPQRDYWETKAVYAPVRIVEDSVDFKPGQQQVRLSVYNGYDFLDLANVRFEWELFRNNHKMDTGELRQSGAPHVTSRMVIPTGQLPQRQPGDVDYLHIAIYRADGSLMNRQSVRLGGDTSTWPINPPAIGRLRTTRSADAVEVSNGTTRYSFDRRSGELRAIHLGSQQITDGMDLVVWRPATNSERGRYDRRPNQHNWNTYMQGLTPRLLDFRIDETATVVVIHAQMEYRHDELNSFVATIEYMITETGILQIDMDIHPQMDIPELPEVGIELRLAQAPASMAWLGAGPLDSLPGKTSATRYGWWEFGITDPAAHGTKSMLDWARLDSASASLWISSIAGVRMETTDAGAHMLRLLTHLGGAWTKNGPPERPEWHLSLSGELTDMGVQLEKRENFIGRLQILPLQR